MKTYILPSFRMFTGELSSIPFSHVRVFEGTPAELHAIRTTLATLFEINVSHTPPKNPDWLLTHAVEEFRLDGTRLRTPILVVWVPSKKPAKKPAKKPTKKPAKKPAKKPTKKPGESRKKSPNGKKR